MEEIIRKNYAGSSLVEGVLKGLRSAFGKDNNRFYVLKKDDKIISFNRFETKPPLTPPYKGGETRSIVEFASFNTDPAYQKSAIGRVMMEKTLDAKAHDNVVVAETDPMSPVASHYVEQAGFVIVGAQEYKDTGVFVFEIERDDHKQYARTGEIVALGKGADVAHRVQELTSQGKVLTRYFKEGHVFKAVIEEKQD